MAGPKAVSGGLRVVIGDDPKKQNPKRKYSPGEAAGITVGVVAAVLAVVGLYFGSTLFWARQQQKGNQRR
jgi:hypothetical protein